MTDDAFLRTIQETPNDDTTRLIYADWLEERDDELSMIRARFIRADCEVAAMRVAKAEWLQLAQRRRELAAQLDADWLAVVSKLPIEECSFKFQCTLRWEHLQPVGDAVSIRFCDKCEQHVYYCDTIGEAQIHAWKGQCVAIDARLVRKKGDLDMPDGEVMGEMDDVAMGDIVVDEE